MLNLVMVAAGGAVGALMRYGVYRLMDTAFLAQTTIATLTINVFGSFVLGFLWSVTQQTQVDEKFLLLVFVGVLGSFTTFSTYALEGYQLLADGQLRTGLTYIAANNFGSLGLVFLGVLAGRQFAG